MNAQDLFLIQPTCPRLSYPLIETGMPSGLSILMFWWGENSRGNESFICKSDFVLPGYTGSWNWTCNRVDAEWRFFSGTLPYFRVSSCFLWHLNEQFCTEASATAPCSWSISHEVTPVTIHILPPPLGVEGLRVHWFVYFSMPSIVTHFPPAGIYHC